MLLLESGEEIVGDGSQMASVRDGHGCLKKKPRGVERRRETRVWYQHFRMQSFPFSHLSPNSVLRLPSRSLPRTANVPLCIQAESRALYASQANSEPFQQP